jgi:type IV pilus assembly protein PilA
MSRPRSRPDDGFTLIELLVVIIIIGILAAVAIPTFLQQKRKAVVSAMHSDVASATAAEESYSISHSGFTSDITTLLGPTGEGFNASPGVTVTVSLQGTTAYRVCATHPDITGRVVLFDSSNGQTTEPAVCA